jgi:flagellar biosynthesis/type III secretory pathway chaperone
MDTSKIPVAPLFQEKLMLYQELAEVLTKEKQWIVNADVDELWRVSDAKRAIASKIDVIRTRILSMLTDAGIDHKMIPETFQNSRLITLLPAALRKQLAGTLLSLGMVKQEVRSLSRDNKQYIESYLSMLDDLMSVLTGRAATPSSYGSHQKMLKANSPMLFHQEV